MARRARLTDRQRQALKKKKARRNPLTPSIGGQMISAGYIWSGIGMIIKGGYFGPFWNPGLGMLYIAYGIYDLSTQQSPEIPLIP